MKLRRAMAAVAATAAIAPLALLSAPAAFAEEPAGTQTTASAPASSPESTPPGAPESTPAGATPESTPPSDAAGTTTPSTGASGTTTPSATASALASSSASQSASASVSASASRPAEPSEEPSPCTTDDVDSDSQLTIAVSGLPGKIVAGSGWHTFKLTAANHGDRSLGQVQWLALIDNDSMSENEKDWLSTYALLEYLDPATKKWESLADEIGGGIYFGETPLGPRQTVDIDLRVNITAKAPAGDGYTVGLGGYVDQEKNCVHNAFDYYTFTVLKPGSSNDDPGNAKPADGAEPAGGKRPQGGAEEIPPTGSLAATGSSSVVPTLGLVGGIAVVVGAGALVAVRRRKGGADA